MGKYSTLRGIRLVRQSNADKTNKLLEQLDFEQERDTMVKYLPLGWKRLAFSVAIFMSPRSFP